MKSTFLTTASKLLESGYKVRFVASGHSMSPIIKDGDFVTVEPLSEETRRRDIYLYQRDGRPIIHRLVSSRGGNLIMRGDACSRDDEPVNQAQLLGRVIRIERAGHCFSLIDRRAEARYWFHRGVALCRHNARHIASPLAAALAALLVMFLLPLQAKAQCATPGKDGVGGTLTGIVNTYYPGTTATASAGSTSLTLGAATGASTPITAGDLLLIIQMQGADINSSNNSRYGDGVNGGDASGVTALNNTGLYEYIVATNTVPLAGGTLNFQGAGAGSGLINTYTNANATGSAGQRRYQVVRVPQYLSATLSSSLTCAYWNGSTGGILAIDVAGVLTLGGTVSVDGRGFRGGGGRRLTGGSGSNTDYVTLATNNANGSKGEGIAGTPRYVYNQSSGTLVDTGVEGYPNGSYARGAPGNAGGGGTDGQPSANDQNSGGGGGANCGNGGQGGNTWNTNLARGGYGGTGVAISATRIIMGGGGGAGTTNNGTSDPNTNTTGINSSGAAGGGIVMIRAGVVSGTGTITANGANALHVGNDSGGGGGAGGTILVVANSSLSGLTVSANGGNGGNAWLTQAPGGTPGNRHGPGAGGGGGSVLLSSAPASISTTGGANGRTTTALDPYNSTSGSSGCSLTNVTFAQIPGIQAGVQCTADVAVTKTASPDPVNQGNTLTYTITVTNNGLATAQNVSMTDPLPSGVTFSSVNTTQGTCSFSLGTVSCAIGTLASGSSATITIQVTAGSPTIITNTASVTNTVLDAITSNNSASVDTTIVYPTAVQMRSFMAAIIDGRAYIKWLTGREVSNLGFHLYREVNGERRRVTNSLIAGSALMVGPYAPIAAGPSYGFIDDLSGNAEIASGAVAVNYWLEQIDLDGKRSWYGPISAIPTDQAPPAFRISPKLTEFGNKSSWQEQRYFADLNDELAYATATPAQISTQYAIAAQAAIKIAVRKSGWYRVKQPDLLAAGMAATVDPRRLRLYVDGKEQPIKVFDESDGQFDADDYVEFYGSGQDTASTDSRIYWLVVGTTNGLRIRDVASPPRVMSSDSGFLLTVERRDREVYFAALNNGDAENFFGPIVSTAPLNQVLTLRNLDTSQPSAALEVSLQGVSDNSSNPADHRVRILLNGSLIGDLVFDGQTLKTARFNISASRLREGENTVTLSAVNGDADVSLVNYVRITYPHTFVADNNYLEMVVPAGKTLRVSGFSGADVRVVDITNPELPQELIGTIDTANSTSAISFFVPATGMRRLVAFSGDGVSAPASLKLNKPSRWNSRSNTADIVMLSHESFLDSLTPLKAARTTQGRVSVVVDVEDIYDEFSFGAKSPQAIKDFLLVARTWIRAPKFLLLVGDASIDPRNYLGFGETDFVPTKTVATELMETASDDWFADFNNDDLADIAVGRLSCRTLDEARLLVGKILAFEQALRSSPAGSWRDQALMVADRDDVFGFTKSTIALSSRLPANFSKVMVLLNDTDEGSARRQIINAINSGKLLVNYFGHGSVEVWTRASLFTSDDSQALTNGNRLPFFVMMNCLNGFFHDLFTESLAESLQRAQHGGAVAVWASSGLAKAGDQSVMNNQLYQELFSSPTVTIGEAVMRAKRVVKDKDLQRSWILFGDPAMRVR